MDYSKHPEVDRLANIGAKYNRLKKDAREGALEWDAKQMTEALKDANVVWMLSECRKLKKMIRNDSEVLLETNFDGESGLYLTFTKSKAILLLMRETNDILERKLSIIEKNSRPVRRSVFWKKDVGVLNSGF